MTVSTRYRHTGFVLVRATTDPGDLDLPSDLDLHDPTAVALDGRAWLDKTWARTDVREAITAASPALAAHLDRLTSGRRQASAKDLRRAVASMASYALRWQRRATPFGFFAGVGTATIGPASAHVGAAHQAVVRADAEWLTTVIDQLENHPGLLTRLSVMADGSATVRGGRLIVARRAGTGTRTPGPLQEASIRHTRPVQVALAAAKTPIRYPALYDTLADRFPGTSAQQVHGMLHGLIGQRFLITSLRPPMTAVDGLGHLIGELRAAGVSDLADLAAVLGDLEEIHSRLASVRDLVRGAPARAEVAATMAALAPAEGSTLAVDVRLDARISIPEPVLSEAALAASVLLRVTPQPFGTAAWLDYHARFLSRYGPGALVPVWELVADSGLGYPGGFLGAPRARPSWRMLTERDAALLALIQRAAVDGTEEIELTDGDIDALTVGEHGDIVPPQRIELGVELHAPSAWAIDHGDFLLRVTAAPRIPTSMAGRFTHLLGDTGHALLAGSFSVDPQETTGTVGVVAVQLSFPPRRPHNENVVRVRPLLPAVVHVAEHSCQQTGATAMGVDDLAVTVDADQMYLVQISTGRRVAPQVPHALDTVLQTPLLARFLAEVGDARTAVFGPLDLGAARTLPYVPRLRYRRTVLSAARWILTSGDLHHGVHSGGDQDSLHAWRRRWRASARVVLCAGETRLPLDLDRPLDRGLLTARLERTGRIELHEDGPPDGQRWIGRPAELLIPMVVTGPRPRPLPVTCTAAPTASVGAGPVVHAQLAGNPARFDEILTSHLPGFLDELTEATELWWVRRYRDMIRPDTDHHLAVIVRLADQDRYASIAAAFAAFAEHLHANGLPAHLTLAPYQPHPGRYGHGPALVAAERVFATDTTAAIAQLTAAESSGVPAQALAAASMAHLAAAFAPDPATGSRALIACLDVRSEPVSRAVRDQALRLSDPSDGYATVRELPAGEAVAHAWFARDTALTAYHQVLRTQRDPATVLRTLLHQHHVRAVGVDPTFERQTGRLARAAALRHLARAGAP